MASHNDMADTGDQEKKQQTVSFGFSKTVSKFKPVTTDSVTKKEERDYLTGIDRNELQSTKPQEKPKELIIPLIQKNHWHKPTTTSQNESKVKKGEEASQENDSVVSQAVKELIEDSRRQLDQWQNGTDSEKNVNMSIPLLMQNKVPEGFEDGDQLIDIKPIEHQLRPKGLGLGADRSAIKDLEPSKHKRPPKPGEERDKEEELVMGPGGCVQVQSGAHKELYGKIEGLDADNARVMVKLAIGGKTVTISQYAVKLVGRKEYEKYGKDLSRLSKAHKEKEREKEKDKEKQKREEGALQMRPNINLQEKPVKEPKRPPAAPSWLQRDLKVRFIDKTFKGGKYYNSKMRIEDVLTPTICVCRTEEGRLLDDIKQDMLETIIPKSEHDSIMVVMGEHKGQVGRILQRDKNKCKAMVQLDRYEEKVFTLDYDIICHYVGVTDH
ncbi:hypothetical protein WMY93_032622 [Mugilogobius chulae]|uniref:G-patch domain and KOW motifs-containing protein n=1 Tax=Mugilogobius chulae TaxID=88201 RepID=A0AAW0MJ29_9GOBI